MKRIILTAGAFGLLALAPGTASAHADLHIGIFAPAPFYVAPPPVYYEPPQTYYSPPPVYYGPDYGYEREWHHHRHWHGGHDRGRHGDWRRDDDDR
jgi:hypothetical protein